MSTTLGWPPLLNSKRIMLSTCCLSMFDQDQSPRVSLQVLYTVHMVNSTPLPRFISCCTGSL